MTATTKRACVICGADISERRPDAQTCSDDCRREKSNRRKRAALMDPNPSSALAMTSKLDAADALSSDLPPETTSDTREDVGRIATASDGLQAPSSPFLSDEAKLDPLRVHVVGKCVTSVDWIAGVLGRTVVETTDLLARVGVPVQADGIIDGNRLERALSADGLTAVERSIAARPPSQPAVLHQDYPGGPMLVGEGMRLDLTEGVYSLGRVIDRGGDPWGDRDG
jgi:predicted nucleic acid-binding Zn ribbon protein